MIKASWSGDLADRLAAMPTSLSKPILVRALKAAAEPIRSRTASLAPVSSPDAGKPGHLSDHIAISATNRVAGRALESDEAAVAIGPTRDFWWAMVQEFGPHNGRYSAHPFMRPGFDGGSAAALGVLQEHLWIEIRKAAESGVGAKFTGTSAGAGRTL